MSSVAGRAARCRARVDFPAAIFPREFEINPFVDEFYAVSRGRPAVMLERTPRWEDIPPEFTLEEVSAGVPWRRK